MIKTFCCYDTTEFKLTNNCNAVQASFYESSSVKKVFISDNICGSTDTSPISANNTGQAFHK